MGGREWCQQAATAKRRRLFIDRPNDRPSPAKYGGRFSAQSLQTASAPLIGEETHPSVQFSPVILCNLNPVLT